MAKIARPLSRRKCGQQFTHRLAAIGVSILHTTTTARRACIFGLVNNLSDRHHGVFALFNLEVNLEAGNLAAPADPAPGDDCFSNPRTITPAASVAAYGGVEVKFW